MWSDKRVIRHIGGIMEASKVKSASHSVLKSTPRKRYVVVMYNDNSTPMDFVVQILIEVFNFSLKDAIQLMLQVHLGDKRVIGTFPKKLADAKVAKALGYATQEGYNDFRLEVKEV